MFKHKTPALVGLLVLAIMAGLGLSACGAKTHLIVSPSDTTTCVYDTWRGGNSLIAQVGPGDNQEITTSHTFQTVQIPTSGRFYMAAQDDSIRDPGAPRFYPGYAQGAVQVNVEGQVRFQFNVPKACEWYAKHGRRNANNAAGDLGFNVRGDPNQGWFHFLAENFGFTMNNVVQKSAGAYSWPALVYHYSLTADDTGVVPANQTPGPDTVQAFADALGAEFTKELDNYLQGDYFCGVTQATTGTSCAPMTFQVLKIMTNDPTLMANRAKFESDKQAVDNAVQEGKLQHDQQAAELAAEAAKQAVLAAQVKSAQLTAENDPAVQKCLILAPLGLDCNGNRPPIIVGGQTVTPTK